MEGQTTRQNELMKADVQPGEISSQCMACKHLFHAGDLAGFGWTCEAFPDGIPVLIVTGEQIHDVEVYGDHGIQFEQV